MACKRQELFHAGTVSMKKALIGVGKIMGSHPTLSMLLEFLFINGAPRQTFRPGVVELNIEQL